MYYRSWFNTVFHKLPIYLDISAKNLCLRTNTYLGGGGMTDTDGYYPIILLSSLGISKPMTEISKQTIEISKIFKCTFSAGKQETQSQQHFVIMLKKMFITTLCYKCHEDQQISEYMNRQEHSDCNSLIKNTFQV